MFQKDRLILNNLYNRPEASQRELSLVTGISLGQVNAIIRNLCDNGLVKQENITKRKCRYTLTQGGMAERARLSNDNILTTIKNYNKIQDSVKSLLNRLHGKGYKEFVLDGERCEMHDVVRDVFERLSLGSAVLLWGPAEDKEGQVVLNLGRRYVPGANTVNVLHEINI